MSHVGVDLNGMYIGLFSSLFLGLFRLVEREESTMKVLMNQETRRPGLCLLHPMLVGF